MIEFKTINSEAIGTIVEKKSKFIATIIPVSSKKETEEKINEVKKKYADARHNCYAYCVLEDEIQLTKSSDDGEPSGTAGQPILKVIKENNLCNVLIIVTRYFGGILLGTGGLQRAYTESAQMAIKNSKIINMQIGYEIELEIDYSNLNYLKYFLEKENGRIINTKYTEKINLTIQITENGKTKLINTNSEIGNKIQKINNISKKYVQKNIDI